MSTSSDRLQWLQVTVVTVVTAGAIVNNVVSRTNCSPTCAPCMEESAQFAIY